MQSALGAFLRDSGIGARLKGAEPMQAWDAAFRASSPAQVSGAVSVRARAVRFRAGVLTVEVASSALLQELESFTGETFRRSANNVLGREVIHRVDFQLKH